MVGARWCVLSSTDKTYFMDIKKLVGTATLALSLVAVSPALASSKGELRVEGSGRSTSLDAGIVVENGDDSRGRGEDEVRGRGSDDVRLETRSSSSDERIGHDSGDDDGDDSILSDDRGGTSTVSGSRHDELEDIDDDHGGRRSRTFGSILSDELARFGIGSTSTMLSASTTVTAEDRQDFAEIFVNFFAKIGGWFRGHGGRSED